MPGDEQNPLFDEIALGECITTLKPSARRPEKVSIRVGRRVAATIDQRHLAEIGLHVGQIWDEALRERVGQALQYDKARTHSINSLARRALSRKKLLERLATKGYELSVRERVADDLERMGLIDDTAYAESIARGVVRSRPAGRRLLEMKLRQRGLDRKTISEAADAVLHDRDERDDARELAEQRLARMSPTLDAQARSRRLYALLARRGFASEVCSEVVREIVRDQPRGDA